MVTTNSHSGSYRETYLKNESTSIADLSQGKRTGIIAEAGETWQDPFAAENTDTAQFEYQTTLKGEWTGQGRDAHQMAANELTFASKQNNETFELRQNLRVDLEKKEISQGFISPHLNQDALNQPDQNTYTQGKFVAELGVSLKDSEGKSWAEFAHAETQLDGQSSHETRARIQTSESVSLSGTFAKENSASQTSTLGMSYTPELEGHVISLNTELQQGRTDSDAAQGLSASATFDDLNLNYSQQKTTQKERVDGVQTGNQQENLGVDYAFLEGDLNLAYSEQTLTTNTPDYNDYGDAVVGYEQTKNTEFTAGYQITKEALLGFSHSKEITTRSASPGQANTTESNTFSMQYTFDENWKGQAAYTDKPSVSKHYMGQLSYQETDEFTLAKTTWDAQFDIEDSLVTPGLKSQQMQFQYAATQLHNQSLSFEGKLSYQSQSLSNLSTEKWDANLRAYGSGANALPFEAVLRLSSDPNDSMGVLLNYFVEF